MEKLGEGANGVVRKCQDRKTNEIYAVKIGKMEEEHMMALERIVNMMRRLKHDNILNNKELYRDSKRSKYYHVI
jgi:serine/threonine protein kinase